MLLRYKRFVIAVTLSVFSSSLSALSAPPVTAKLVGVKRIWDHAPHNAFTDLVRWRDRWYCAFREGKGHAGDIGKLRVIASKDGKQWESATLLAMKDYDLRDAALSITPEGQLMVLGGAQQNRDGSRQTGTFVSFSQDGKEFSEPRIVVPLGRWLWRVTWHEGRTYGVTYATPAGKPHSALLTSEDGIHFKKHVAKFLGEGGWPTEARIRFAPDGTCYCLHRRDGANNTAYLGSAKPPYQNWRWSDLGRYLGGPNFVQIPSGHWIGAGRLLDGGARTEVVYLDMGEQTMTPILRLPSGGDTSYPGMVWHDGELWISYYSSHEAKTSIYLARVALEVGKSDNTERAQADAINIGSRHELFVDDFLVDRLNGATLQLHRPVDRGPVLRFDRPWEGSFCGYCTVIQDGDIYRLYYRGLPKAGADGSATEVTCYAESPDGVHWTKPDLDLFPADGSKQTNIILAGAAPANHNFSPFLDRNPDALPDERYKALGGTSKSGLLGFASRDGIHWKPMGDQPIFHDQGWVFDSQNVCFWSEAEKCYVLYYRKVPDGVRAIARATSKDFEHWSEPVMMTYSDTQSRKPSHHLYTNQTHPYFRAPHIYLATAARFMPGRRVLSEEQARSVGVHPSYFGDTADAVLLTTRGGHRYQRTFLTALIRPGIGAENWVSRTNYPALNIVPTSDTEMSLYVNQNYGQPTSHLRRYTFRLDGLASVHGPYGGGDLVTKPLIFRGRELVLNFATSAAGGIRVEIQDPDGRPFDGARLQDCQTVIGNEIERVVQWKGGGNVEHLAGKPVRLRFELTDADLFSLQFRP